jgi:hypothetical protein
VQNIGAGIEDKLGKEIEKVYLISRCQVEFKPCEQVVLITTHVYTALWCLDEFSC